MAQVRPNLADTPEVWVVGGPRLGRLGARGISAILLLAAAGFLAATMADSASASNSNQVTPILECVWHDSGTAWTSLWGYSNSSSSTQTIPIGSSNSFSPGAQNQGQPTTFKPGTVDNLFTVPFTASDPPAWSLDGTTVSSSPSDKKCSSDPVPIIAGTTGWSGEVPLIFVAIGILGVGFCCWRYAPDLLGLGRNESHRS